MRELRNWVEQDNAIRIEFRCSPYYQNSALYPVIEHLQRLLQWQKEDTVQTRTVKLQVTLARYRFPQADTLALFAALLSLPAACRYASAQSQPPTPETEDRGSLDRLAGGRGRTRAGVLRLGRFALG